MNKTCPTQMESRCLLPKNKEQDDNMRLDKDLIGLAAKT